MTKRLEFSRKTKLARWTFAGGKCEAVCRVDDCKRPSRRNGLCHAHYARERKFGDPLKGPPFRRPRHTTADFMREALAYLGDECLICPFSDNGNGYRLFRQSGKNQYVHRFICEQVYGPPPFDNAIAAHSCGNGHLGCATQRHLRWTTPAGNSADRIAHGNSLRGESHPSAKLTENEVHSIRSDVGPDPELAKKYGVARSTIQEVRTGKRWSWLTEYSDAP